MSKKNEAVQPATVAAQPATEVKTKSTPVNERQYRLIAAPAVQPKGKQRQIVLNILVEAKRNMTVEEVTKAAEAAGLSAKGGVGPSCRYHLHHLTLLGITEVVNKTTEIAKPADKKAAA